jgi:RecA/RadA recombinase
MSETDKIKKMLAKKAQGPPKNRPGLSAGCTLLNLACSDRPYSAYTPGKYYFFVGKSSSGKTWFTLSSFAEASINEHFKDYRLIYGDEEGGAMMDMAKHFGPRMASRLEVTRHRFVEDYYDYLEDCFADGRPFIYVLDSMDALKSREDEEKRLENKKLRTAGKETSGSYGMAKPKCNSNNINWVCSKLEKSGSMLFVISQTRANIGYGSQFNPDTRSGGTSLTFYATLEIWTGVKEKIKKTVRGKPRTIGIMSQIKVKKNRQSGKDRVIHVPIHWSSGIDDLGSCVDYLISEKHWEGTDTKVTAPEFDFSGGIEKFIEKVEAEGRENELRDVVATVWREVDEACEVKRKSRYT